jgi:hypothetical protein
MERFLLLWDEMDDYAGIARLLIGEAMSEVAGVAQRGTARVSDWSSAASSWLSLREAE